MRDGTCLAQGAVRNVLTRSGLEDLYRAPIEQLDDPSTGGSAFLPGYAK
jgi:ABC-type cobalamin/Fe3+-siderophores transport system ATPase subunit